MVGKGSKHSLGERREMIGLIDEACRAGARLHKACQVAGLSERTLQRWQAETERQEDGRKAAAELRKPANALPEALRQLILETANQPRFADKTPHQIVPLLADEGTYLASESSIYRILRQANQLAHRGKAKAPEWVQGFVHWYNEQHLHSEIRFVTPNQRQAGLDSDILAKRHRVYKAAKAEHLQRWSGKTRNWEPVGSVSLNPNKQAKEGAG